MSENKTMNVILVKPGCDPEIAEFRMMLNYKSKLFQIC